MVCLCATVCTISPSSWSYANELRWSFGGNRLQIKAETHVLADVQANLDAIGKTITIGVAGSKLKAKQDLLSLLIADEQSRLMVWLYPLDHAKKHHFTSSQSRAGLPEVSTTVEILTRKLIVTDCCNCSFEDGLGREPGDRSASPQALPIPASRH